MSTQIVVFLAAVAFRLRYVITARDAVDRALETWKELESRL